MNRILEKIGVHESAVRGFLFDAAAFFLNLLLFTVLAARFRELLVAANANDKFAKYIFIFYAIGCVFLLPLGTIFKRVSAHERGAVKKAGILRNAAAIGTFFTQLIFLIVLAGNAVEFNGSGAFAYLFFGVPVLAFLNTFIVTRYFKKPRYLSFSFLRNGFLETVGDVLIIVNFLFFQVFWSYLAAEMVKDFAGIANRLMMFGFAFLMIYLPPRLVYLSENSEKKAWAGIVLANIPTLAYIFLA